MGKVFKRYKGNDNTPTPVKSKPIPTNTTPIPTPTPTVVKNKPHQTQTPSAEETPKHGFFGLAKNLATSLIAWQKAGRPVVTSEQWDARLAICRGCEYWQEIGTTNVARCKKCGCSSGKLLLATSRCPLNPPKWDSV